MTPKYWLDFITENSLVGKDVDIPEENDASLEGATFSVFDQGDIEEEATEYYPGLIVSKDGYIPVGGHTHGSGDSYFINIQDGPRGPLYRIYHDVVTDKNYDKQTAVVRVLGNYTMMMNFVE